MYHFDSFFFAHSILSVDFDHTKNFPSLAFEESCQFFTRRKELNVENKTEEIETLNFSEPEVYSRIRII